MYEILQIHPDFQNIRKNELSLSRPRLALINSILKVQNAFKQPKFNGKITKHKIAGLNRNSVPVMVIKPDNLPPRSPALIYYHGGAFIYTYSSQHIENAVQYALGAKCCIVFVDYRLTPKYTFPSGFDDCYAALLWTRDNANALGIDSDNIAIGGDSAGGALAAGVAQKAVDNGIRLRGQLLLYPTTDRDGKTNSSAAFADVQPFRNLSAHAMWDAYLGAPKNNVLPAYASPIHGKLTGLAPAYVETLEFDPLRDEGENYAQDLLANGVAVVANAIKGTVHGFDLLAPESQISKDAVRQRIQFLQKIFAV